jgi:NAD(P)H dehydrogenase (quinone)
MAADEEEGMATPSYAVTGATGRLGGLVARRLADRGQAQRLVVRDPSRAPALPGAEVAQATYADGEAMRRALAGVPTLFLVSGSEAADRVREHVTAVDAAVAAGVERIVYVSFLGAAPDATFTFARDHWHTEQHILASGVPATFLRDSLYQLALVQMGAAGGVLRGPAGDGRVAAVAHEDVADVAVAVLLGDGHERRTYDLTGPEALDLHRVAELVAEVLERPFRYQPETLEEAYASRAAYAAPDWEVAGWVTSYAAIASGELDVVGDAVERVAGHPPVGLADYLRRHRDELRRLLDG